MFDKFCSSDSASFQMPPAPAQGDPVPFRAESEMSAAAGGPRSLLQPGILLNLLSLSLTPLLSDAIGPALTLPQGRGNLL